MPSLSNSEMPLGDRWTPGPLVERAGCPHFRRPEGRQLVALVNLKDLPEEEEATLIPLLMDSRVFSGIITDRTTRAILPLRRP